MIQAQFEPHFKSWRSEARKLLQSGVKPQDVYWQAPTDSFLLEPTTELQPLLHKPVPFLVPKEFMEMAEFVACVRDEKRWDLLYRILYRILNEKKDLLEVSIDKDIHQFNLHYKSVRRDIHKMHAFVRFKKMETEEGERYVAWHKPEHLITEKSAGFFMRRFGDKPWSIFTPDISAHWDLKEITFTEGIPQHQFPHTDDFDEIWKSYYKSIFNPARIKVKAMKMEFAAKYWQSLPEAELIPSLIREAPARLQKMALNQNTHAIVDQSKSLAELKSLAFNCKACPLYAIGTQTVFGEGPEHAEIMIVGEQPGDQEDRQGKPFVGPAGEILNECLQINGIKKEELYLTNAVKHFKWTPQGDIRLHKKASGQEMHACKPWLEAEIAKVKPKVIIALGATAGTAILGKLPKISQERGKVFTDLAVAPYVILSWHPSAILRAYDHDEAQKRKSDLIADLKLSLRCLDESHC